ncbi:ASCH/PUA domain-containing protein [Aeromonas hydrophila]|uniref:ASCH/PUA domain-containing protein n=1 Tax=Aeromonas hydrophila TaxID=644 RepID=UPI0008083969|nr:ASCH/PUA domain-containing protein [Aeromonas hydrophila]OCA67398.1 hypothetical protein A9R12_01770 [Aeromonas hydrophila]CAD7529622.1 hypothetical protein KBAH04_17360 [Aeromonas hydrophila]
MKHELKIKPEYFAAVFFGQKTFEIRNNTDRNFQVGDTLVLKAWDGEFTGDFVEKVVSYITDFEQKPGYVVLGLVSHREHELLEKFHRTGVAIERAISTGSVLADHPLKSRLELLANHHKREQDLADGMVVMGGRCQLLADLLKEVTQVIPAIGVAADDMPVVDAFLDRIEAALAGQVKGRTITEGQELELSTVLQAIANGFSDDPAHDAAALLKRIAGEVPWTGDSFQFPPRQGGEPCDSVSLSSSPD